MSIFKTKLRVGWRLISLQSNKVAFCVGVSGCKTIFDSINDSSVSKLGELLNDYVCC